VLPFGVLIFVVGSLLIANAWAVVDAKMATGSAAREAARAYVEADTQPEGWEQARLAADDTISSYGRSPEKLGLTYNDGTPFVRCNRMTFVASYTIPSISLPFGIGFGSDIEARSRHSEIIDPVRSGLPEANACGY